MLGPGDSVVVELMDIPEYSGIFTIGPDGSIYLPRIHSLFVEGLTIKELTTLLEKEFNKYVLDTQVFVGPAAYRPIRVYIGGEVARPGYYYLSGQQSVLGLESNRHTMPNNGQKIAANTSNIYPSTPLTSKGSCDQQVLTTSHSFRRSAQCWRRYSLFEPQ